MELLATMAVGEERSVLDGSVQAASIDPDLNLFLSPAAFWLPEKIVQSAWLQHAPFAFWLVQALRPARLVELGTHHGFSYLAFCQAVRRLALPTRCFAVDTWAGDEHAGRYAETVYRDLTAYHDPLYADFSRLVRARFDVAVQHFADGSIDLLHIDGRHFYEDVREDYELWRPKLSSRSVVLFHDTNVRERNFGVWRLWAEIAEQRPHIEFLHGHGLGVLGYGGDLPKAMRDFFDVAAAHPGVPRETYFRLGSAIEDRFARGAVMEAPKPSPASPAPAASPIPSASPAPAATRETTKFHIHLVAMAPSFLEVRTRLPLRGLAEVPGIGTSIDENKIEPPRLPLDLPKILILQRFRLPGPRQWRGILAEILSRGWVVVAEMDDHPALIAETQGRAVDENSWNLVRYSHAVQTSTPTLVDAMRPYNPEIVIFPNCAFSLVPVATVPRPDGRLRVFFGALHRERFSALIGRALAPLAAARRDIEFVVVHDRAFFDSLGEASKSFMPALSYEDYLRTMEGCDIALIPLEGTNNELYKSDVKFVEASSRGLASIVSPAVYGDTVRDGATGLVADHPSAWVDALARLHADPALRVALATAAQNSIRTTRMFADQVDTRLKWYESLWERRFALTASLNHRLRQGIETSTV